MIEPEIKRSLLTFRYLPAYAAFLRDHHLEEFVKVGIRFCRQFELPLMKPLARLPEHELIKLSIEGNREMLDLLAENKAAEFISTSLRRWIENRIGVIDQMEVQAEDLTLVFFIRRKLFSHFLYTYSPNPAIHQLITEEVDMFTTQEELANMKVYLQMHKVLS